MSEIPQEWVEKAEQVVCEVFIAHHMHPHYAAEIGRAVVAAVLPEVQAQTLHDAADVRRAPVVDREALAEALAWLLDNGPPDPLAIADYLIKNGPVRDAADVRREVTDTYVPIEDVQQIVRQRDEWYRKYGKEAVRGDRLEAMLDRLSEQADAHLARAQRAEKDAADVRREAVEPFAQAMHDARGILGFDNDGDETPAAQMGSPDLFIAGFLADMRQQRADYDEACQETADVRREVAEECMGIAFEEAGGTEVGRRIGQRIAREAGERDG